MWGHAVAQLVEAPRYKTEGRGFDSRLSLEYFHWHNPSGRTMALGLTWSITEMNTRNISWGVKAAGALRWQTYYPNVPIVLKSGSLKLLKPSGVVQAFIYIYIYIYLHKGKAVPLQAWSGPEGSRKLRFPDFMTTVQNGGKVVSLTHRPPLPLGNAPGTHFC